MTAARGSTTLPASMEEPQTLELERALARKLGAAAAGLTLLGVGIVLLGILRGNHGVFSYTLDDAYVHLELARNLAHGHHGVEPGEFSSPCSSILWPALLLPAVWAGVPFFAPLVLNVVAAVLAAAALGAWFARVLGPSLAVQHRIATAALVVAMVLAANLIALPLAGMEHTLQVALTCWLAVGLIDVDRGLPMPRWLVPLCITLPLIRLEMLGIVLLSAAWLGWRGWRKGGLAIFLGVLATVLPYLIWLHARTGLWLPMSVLSKRGMYPPAIVELYNPAVLVPLLFAGFSLVRARRRAEPSTGALVGIALAGALGHDLFAQVGLFNRYVTYIGVFVALVSAWSERDAIRAALSAGGSRARLVLWVAAILAVVNARGTVAAIGAGEHIWRLHGQLRRIATEVVDGPVAVNDIGWVSYDNDRPVLDLVGLSSRDALTHRLAHDPPEWMEELVAARRARIIMVYAHWFEALPASWVQVGTLVVDMSSFDAQDGRVSLLAPDAESAPSLMLALRRFAEELPDGVHIEFVE